eukprot:TRINITY_DN2291_c2_g1_i2.p1 TRINITY_DN2291_c2_g1~~TRINITY_DN2291_c2_g1_i2.p1  ORF type:complete len:245 (+),score=11.67 TRINITY_DN2291_c2_g1_i2:39-773(+)
MTLLSNLIIPLKISINTIILFLILYINHYVLHIEFSFDRLEEYFVFLNVQLFFFKSLLHFGFYIISDKNTDVDNINNDSSLLGRLIVSIIGLIIGWGLLHFIFVLFGANLMDNFFKTTTFSLFLSLLVLYDITFEYNSVNVLKIVLDMDILFKTVDNSENDSSLLNKKTTTNTQLYLYITMIITLIGTWMGAFVIPLDWDRWWQPFPISSFFASVMFFFMSQGLLLIYFIILLLIRSILKSKQI